MPETLQGLNYALEQVPRKEYKAEAQPLAARLELLERRAKGPRPLSEALAIVLARSGVGNVQSQESGEVNLA
jgi:hypothetical protein